MPEVQASSSSASSVTNGGAATDNNNRRVSKQKWVQFPIDLSKSRSKRDRDRAPRTRRTETAPVQNGVDAEDDDHSSDTTNKNTTAAAASRVRRFRPSATSGRGRSPNVGGTSSSAPRGGRRTIGSSRPSNGPRQQRNALNYADYPTEFRLANKLGSEGPPYLMPYMGTFYYDGVPSYKTDSLSITDAIKKQM